ncbi:alpha-L-rhamnosidase C-terminal domain-containing protein [Cohnella sp. GbtcB17]|uniref:alpha-L-rhamnosidase-related protein n=1 Tax=Cohnella sp. GbtcB17 TaxID=2824762 RepID=UPI001C30745C|nr:alpha-L-rhamnosidase C-terminal domain-containing protein [Cohnella sp. GbtcB17]
MSTHQQWQASWIWHDHSPIAIKEGEHEKVYFRRKFQVPDVSPVKLVIHVSADSRYRLYVNGKSVAVGPCKGDRHTHYYETVDATKFLVKGTNLLSVMVLHFTTSEPFKVGAGGPTSIWRANTGAFFFEGVLENQVDRTTARMVSDEEWLCLKDESLSFYPGRKVSYVGGVERVDGSLIPHGWLEAGYDDSHWKPAVIVSDAYDPTYGQLTPWPLTPRPIPMLFEEERTFRAIVWQEGEGEGETAVFLAQNRQIDDGSEGYKLMPGQAMMLELDAGELTTGYLQVAFSGGRGGTARILPSECYEDEPESGGERNKGIRDDSSKRILFGEEDIYRVAGTGNVAEHKLEIYEPFWFRTFRFVRLRFEAGDVPLVVHRLHYRETGYPLEVKARFQCSDESLQPLWEISINTLRRCMHETYEDCPYYEQLQYAMDTFLQIVFTYHLSADDRLARKAIFDFHSSQLPNGMLQSRYPSVLPQIIPGFSLYWIMMVYDHYRYYGDKQLVRSYLATMDALLDWFACRLDHLGLVGAMPPMYWSFVDWVEQWHDHAGVPPASQQGPLTVYSLMYAAALQYAATLNESAGRVSTAEEYTSRAEAVKEAVRLHCWSAERQLFRDGPATEDYSEHVQIWSVISGTVKEQQARALIVTMLQDDALAKVSYAMSYFWFRALSMAGLYERAFEKWETWRRLVRLNLTTWVEDPISQRSDCHAWGAVPLYEFTAEILGVKPSAPGFQRIRVAPQPGYLKWAKGEVATPHGNVKVEWQMDHSDTFILAVDGPPRIPVEIVLPNGEKMELPEATSFKTIVKLSK